MVSSIALEAVALGAIVAITGIAVVVLLLQRMRRRQLKLREAAATPEFASDRAYNRLALARREAGLLAAQGGDTSRAQDLIGLAEQAFNGRQFDRAYELAQSAHETLVRARRQPALTAPPGAATAALPGPSPRAAALPAGPAAPAFDPAVVTKNRAEAQFQLRLFEQDLVKARQSAAAGQPNAEARQLYVAAQAAFARGEYGEAFRLSLRGRRKVGAVVEAVGTARGAGAEAPPRLPSSSDPGEVAERVATAERCPQCGHPTSSDDLFCRGCGAARSPTACGRCGAPRAPDDTFCGRCGLKFGSSGP